MTMNMKACQFHMRVDAPFLARLNRWRGQQDGVPSRSESIRQLVDVGFAMSELLPGLTPPEIIECLPELRKAAAAIAQRAKGRVKSGGGSGEPSGSGEIAVSEAPVEAQILAPSGSGAKPYREPETTAAAA